MMSMSLIVLLLMMMMGRRRGGEVEAQLAALTASIAAPTNSAPTSRITGRKPNTALQQTCEEAQSRHSAYIAQAAARA